jgi:hypothetical protein
MSRPYLRHTARIEGDFVVFLIGLYVAKPWRIFQIIRVGRAMNAMVRELEAKPELGLLGQERWGGRATVQVQYWRSRDQLLAYARSKDSEHLPAWKRFNEVIAKTNAVGIWHEMYCVPAGAYECVYGNMPPFGLARATTRVHATGKLVMASGRLGLDDSEEALLPPPPA